MEAIGRIVAEYPKPRFWEISEKKGDTHRRYMSPNPVRDGVKNKPIRLPGLKPGGMRRVNTEHHPLKNTGWVVANVSPQRTKTAAKPRAEGIV